jgi:hypothetical protein
MKKDKKKNNSVDSTSTKPSILQKPKIETNTEVDELDFFDDEDDEIDESFEIDESDLDDEDDDNEPIVSGTICDECIEDLKEEVDDQFDKALKQTTLVVVKNEEVKAASKKGANGGPKTTVGKEIVSRNAVKFGLHSNKPHHLDPRTYDSVYAELAAKYGDKDPVRAVLIQQMAHITIRIQRCYLFEIEFFKQEMDPPIIKTIKNPESNEVLLDDEPTHIQKIVHAGSPMSIPIDRLEKLNTIYTKIEGSLVAKLIKYHNALILDEI